ncbi:unnamed protein product, partial [Protopolystoma xenopodis]
ACNHKFFQLVSNFSHFQVTRLAFTHIPLPEAVRLLSESLLGSVAPAFLMQRYLSMDMISSSGSQLSCKPATFHLEPELQTALLATVAGWLLPFLPMSGQTNNISLLSTAPDDSCKQHSYSQNTVLKAACGDRKLNLIESAGLATFTALAYHTGLFACVANALLDEMGRHLLKSGIIFSHHWSSSIANSVTDMTKAHSTDDDKELNSYFPPVCGPAYLSSLQIDPKRRDEMLAPLRCLIPSVSRVLRFIIQQHQETGESYAHLTAPIIYHACLLCFELEPIVLPPSLPLCHQLFDSFGPYQPTDGHFDTKHCPIENAIGNKPCVDLTLNKFPISICEEGEKDKDESDLDSGSAGGLHVLECGADSIEIKMGGGGLSADALNDHYDNEAQKNGTSITISPHQVESAICLSAIGLADRGEHIVRSEHSCQPNFDLTCGAVDPSCDSVGQSIDLRIASASPRFLKPFRQPLSAFLHSKRTPKSLIPISRWHWAVSRICHLNDTLSCSNAATSKTVGSSIVKGDAA